MSKPSTTSRFKLGDVGIILGWALHDIGRPVVLVEAYEQYYGPGMWRVESIDGAGELDETVYYEYELDGPIPPETAKVLYGWEP